MENFLDWLLSYKSICTLVIVAGTVTFVILSRKHYHKNYKSSGDATGVNASSRIYNDKQNMAVNVVSTVIRILVVIGMFLLLLSINGINVTRAFAGLGIASAIAGLAVQDILKDILMGIRILRDEFFKVGDGIRIDGIEGVVVSFNLQSTKIENINDHSVYTVCNRYIDRMEKLSYLVDVDIPLPYELTEKEANKVIRKICGQVWLMEGAEGCYYKGIQEFADSAIMHRIRFFTKPENKPDLKRNVNNMIFKKLSEAGIVIPYQQIDIHVKNGTDEEKEIAIRMVNEQGTKIEARVDTDIDREAAGTTEA